MPHRPVFHLSCADFVSPVSPVSLAAKGFCLVVVFLLFVVFWLVWVVVWVWFVLGFLVPVSLCFFACLSSFTDWCTAHRQQFREQKKSQLCLPFLSGVVLSLGTELMLRDIGSDKTRLLENRGHLCKMNHLAILWKERAAVMVNFG